MPSRERFIGVLVAGAHEERRSPEGFGITVGSCAVRVRVRVREQVSAPGPPQASVATCTGWDSASVQVREADRRRALGWARRR